MNTLTFAKEQLSEAQAEEVEVFGNSNVTDADRKRVQDKVYHWTKIVEMLLEKSEY